MGPECGSWGLPARGTSKRTFCNAFGAMHLPFVCKANECIAKNLDCILPFCFEKYRCAHMYVLVLMAEW